MFEVLQETKKELSEYLKRVGLSGNHVESLEVHFHSDGEVSFESEPKLSSNMKITFPNKEQAREAMTSFKVCN